MQLLRRLGKKSWYFLRNIAFRIRRGLGTSTVDKLESQRAELVKALIHFDTTDPPYSMRREWGLPSSWKWDPKGGPKGQELGITQRFPGDEPHCYRADDFKLRKSLVGFEPEKSLTLGAGHYGEVDRVQCNYRVLARKKVNLLKKNGTLIDGKELQAMKQMSHDHVAQLVGVYVVENSLYTLSYPVAERTLLQYIKLGLVGTPTWANTLLGGLGCLSNALAYMHSVGVKHGDIHSRNVLVLGGRMIWIDFGLAEVSKTNFSPRHHVITSIGDARARDVARLGWLFEEILIGIYGDFQNWNYGASKRKQTDLGKDNLRNFSEAPKQIEQEDFCALFTVMAAEDTKDQPTAALVAQYLRFGHFGCGYTVDWRGDEIVCNTCGDCCRRKEGQSAAG